MSNRIDYLGKLPSSVYLACSGGADSMAILDFLIKGGRDVIVLHFNHGTNHGAEAETFVKEYCENNSIEIRVGQVSNPKASGESPEEYWRNERYSFLSEFVDRKIIMVHHLGDQVENWLFTSIRNGNPTLIPYKRCSVDAVIIRPFLITKKEVFESWCERKKVPYVVDPSNFSDKYARSYIRKELVPRAMKINPGIHKLIKKKVKREFDFPKN